VKVANLSHRYPSRIQQQKNCNVIQSKKIWAVRLRSFEVYGLCQMSSCFGFRWLPLVCLCGDSSAGRPDRHARVLAYFPCLLVSRARMRPTSFGCLPRSTAREDRLPGRWRPSSSCDKWVLFHMCNIQSTFTTFR
jgi:hypothetical protein